MYMCIYVCISRDVFVYTPKETFKMHAYEFVVCVVWGRCPFQRYSRCMTCLCSCIYQNKKTPKRHAKETCILSEFVVRVELDCCLLRRCCWCMTCIFKFMICMSYQYRKDTFLWRETLCGMGSWRLTCDVSHSTGSVLLCVAVCCSVLQCVAVCCIFLLCVAACCSALQCVAVCCSVLQCVAACCSVMQCDAVCCSASKWTRRNTNPALCVCVCVCVCARAHVCVCFVRHNVWRVTQ